VIRRRVEVVLLMSVTLAVSVILIATQPRDVFWGPDSGNRFIQMQSFLRTGGVAIDHRWPIGPHFVDRGGKTYSGWPPEFPIAAAPFYAILGTAGFFVLPIAGTLLLIALLPALTEGSIAPIGIVLIFGTPVLWYTIVFWEHTLAAAILVAAFVLAERERPLIAGLLAGAGTLLREEGYIAIVSIAIAILFARRATRQAAFFVFGATLLLIPLWLINWRVFGHPLGLHAAVYKSVAEGGRLRNFFPFLFEFATIPWARISLVIPAIALVITSPFALPARLRIALFVFTSIGFAGLTYLLVHSANPIRDTLYQQGLFPGIPFSAALFLAIPELWREQRFRLIVVVAGILLTTLALNQNDFGVTWGPRYYFWLFPLIIILAANALGRRAQSRTVTFAAIVLLMSAFAIQTAGIVTLRNKLRFSESLLQAVRQDAAKDVLTDVFWIPEDLASLFYEKNFGFVRNDAELAQALHIVGGRPFLFIAARQFRLVSNQGFAPLLPRVVQRRRIAGSEPMLDVMLLDAR